MKRTFGMLGLAMLLVGTAHAQFSLRAGGNASTLSTPREEYRRGSAEGGIGYQVGLAYEKKLSDRWAVLSELSYRRQSLNLALEDNFVSDGSYRARYLLRLHYLSLPVMMRATFGRFYVEAGPYGALQLAAQEKGIEYRSTLSGGYEVAIDRPATDRYNRFDVGLGAGAGLKLPGDRLAFGLRASTGLLSLTRPLQVYSYSGRLKNQVLEAALSYSLSKD